MVAQQVHICAGQGPCCECAARDSNPEPADQEQRRIAVSPSVGWCR